MIDRPLNCKREAQLKSVVLRYGRGGTSASGCNNNTFFQKELLSCFRPSTYAGHVSLAEAKALRCMPQ